MGSAGSFVSQVNGVCNPSDLPLSFVVILTDEGFEDVKLYYLGGRFKRGFQRVWLVTERVDLGRNIEGIRSWLRKRDTFANRRNDTKCQLHDIKSMEAMDSMQKSKVKWDVEGDENTNFFHGIINKKRSQLAVWGVFDNGVWLTDPVLVKKAFHDHYESRFKKPTSARFKINFPFPNRLTQDQVAELERGNTGIASGLISVLRWNTFLSMGRSPMVVTLLKVTDAKFVNDYRPISLIGSVYKVITKIMATRLAIVIESIISDTQSAFVAKRQILDGPFILHEVLHWCKRKNKKAMFFKVDFAKAYDSVGWDFLIDVLEAFGFGTTWCNLVRETVRA
ncbi:RNA-directed DNA polymerase, eukaryota [Tanacetum coccineum]